jgi:hypothetical protein
MLPFELSADMVRAVADHAVQQRTAPR